MRLDVGWSVGRSWLRSERNDGVVEGDRSHGRAIWRELRTAKLNPAVHLCE
jgi:hypothetical protein